MIPSAVHRMHMQWLATLQANSPVDTPIILDIEASGFGAGSYPIEIGVAMPDGSLHAWLIRPLPEWTHWQDSAEQIHGISRERLLDEGQNLRHVADELNILLRGKTAYSDGWGVDSSWLARLYHEAGVVQRFTLETIYALLSEFQLEKWHRTRLDVLKETGMIPHRAGTDALIIQKTFLFACAPVVERKRTKKGAA